MYDVNLSGKVAVVTGGGRGIGLHIAEALQVVGAVVAITGRDEDALKEAAEEMGDACHPYVCDQRDPVAIGELAARVTADLGAPDILVNNAGAVAPSGPVASASLELWNEIIQTNLTGVFLTTQAFVPAMIEKNRGDIFMIGSTSGKKGDAEWSAYSASKFGLRGFAESLLYEVRGNNIRVTVVNPSQVNAAPDVDATEGVGIHLHAADIAATVVHICGLPHRTLIREVEVWGTNP